MDQAKQDAPQSNRSDRPARPRITGTRVSGSGDGSSDETHSNSPNNIDFLRLLLATCVILAHSVELIDGNRSREPLTWLFGTLSLGDVCVDGFFLLSGYLIGKSALAPGSTFGSFMRRRIDRIIPAFVVAFLLSAFLVALLVGRDPAPMLPRTLLSLITLQSPPYDHAHPLALNASMWTIAYEFRCYLLAGLLAAAGLLRRRRLMLGLTLLGLAAGVLARTQGGAWRIGALDRSIEPLLVFGTLPDTIRLVPIFMVGVCCFLYRPFLDRMMADRRVRAAVTLAVIPLMFSHLFAEPALVLLGAAPFFFLAFRARIGKLRRVTGGWDISYGIYLYAWPVALCLHHVWPGMTALPLALLTLLIAPLFGAASWWAVERPFKPGPRPIARPADVRSLPDPDAQSTWAAV